MSNDILVLVVVVSLWTLPGVLLLALLVWELRVQRSVRAASPGGRRNDFTDSTGDGEGANTPCPGAAMRTTGPWSVAPAPGFAPVTPAVPAPQCDQVVRVDFNSRRRTDGAA